MKIKEEEDIQEADPETEGRPTLETEAEIASETERAGVSPGIDLYLETDLTAEEETGRGPMCPSETGTRGETIPQGQV